MTATGNTATTGLEAALPLSPLQQGILFHGVLEGREEAGYASQVVCELRGELDREAFVAAWRRLARRHPILRTAFVWEGLDEALQVVLPDVAVPIAWHDLSHLSSEEALVAVEEHRVAERRRGFDFTRAPLMRLAVFHLGRRHHRLVWSFHHLVMDGWSEALLVEELARLYRSATGAAAAELPPAPPYSAFLGWLKRQGLEEAEAYWRRVLAGFREPSSLAGDLPGGRAGARQVEIDRRDLAGEASDALRDLARRHRLTLNTLVQGAWSRLLAWEVGSRDVVYGTAVAGRPPQLPGVERIIGPFVNTLPVRVRVEPDRPLLGWLRQIQDEGLEARRFEHAPLVEVQGWSDVPPGGSLFEILYVFQSGPAGSVPPPSVQAGELELRRMTTHGGATNFPLTLEVEPGRRVGLMLNVDRNRYSSRWSGRFLALLAGLLEALPGLEGARLGDLDPVLEQAEERYREESRQHLTSVGRAKLQSIRRRRGGDGDRT